MNHRKKKKVPRRQSWVAEKTISLKKILIIESTQAEEFYEQRREGVLLADLLRLLDIDSTYRVCVDKKHLHRAIREAEKDNIDAIHVSCHGDEDGLYLTNGEHVTWQEFAGLSKNRLHRKLLVLSACNSGSAELSKAFAESRLGPGVIVGTKEDIGWDEAAIAWQLLYRWLNNGVAIQDALVKVANVIAVKLVYRRWVRTEYKRKCAP